MLPEFCEQKLVCWLCVYAAKLYLYILEVYGEGTLEVLVGIHSELEDDKRIRAEGGGGRKKWVVLLTVFLFDLRFVYITKFYG